MECGSSLAEGAWAATAARREGGDAGAASSRLPSAHGARAGLRRLRERLADDVVRDPPESRTGDDGDFPAFVSPYDDPAVGGVPGASQGAAATTPLVYCDQTAAQRPASSIEDYLRRHSLPCHANTHTNITYTGSQSTAFVAEARQIVGECVGARTMGKAKLDAVLFAGNGVTGAVGLLVDCLGLRGAAARAGGDGDRGTRPVVFVGPHEHHSNLLPWRESGCEVVTVPEDPRTGRLDLRALDRLLLRARDAGNAGTRAPGGPGARLLVGAFAAVSNVTGLIADVDRIAVLLHRHGAVACFDYASGAPYLRMDANPPSGGALAAEGWEEEGAALGEEAGPADPSKDALYFSPHKCYGGTSTPGVLVIKKHLISQTNPPSISGGGTVFYVTNQDHRFLSNRIERYEGGTPDSIGIQRVALALLAGRRVAQEYERIAQPSAGTDTKDDATTEPPPPKTLLQFECATHERVVAQLKARAPNLIVLGCHREDAGGVVRDDPSCVGRHVPIFSFLIRCGRRFLHYNYVCAVLNDVFGIQSRGGCQCAGPYSQRLLGLTSHDDAETEVPNAANRRVERALLRSDRPCELLRPGYSRLSLPFKGLREEEADYVVDALAWVAAHGWALLPQYRCDHRTGEWRHWSRLGKPLGKSERRWLSHYDVLATPAKHVGGDAATSPQTTGDIQARSCARLDKAKEKANAILNKRHDPRFLSEVEKMGAVDGMLGSGEKDTDSTLEDLRWYVYPQEVSQYLREGLEEVPETMVDDALLGALDVRMDGKRSNRWNAVSGSDSAEITTSDVTMVDMNSSALQDASMAAKSDAVHFREGDHAGEAPYEEIKAGYEEGELGESCEIFSKARDEWMAIEEFIREYRSALGDVAAEGGTLEQGRKRNLSTIESVPTPQGEAQGNLSPAVAKREKKKPLRDSSQWGQCSVPHVVAGTADSSAVRDSISKHSTGANGDTSKRSDVKPKGKKKKGKIKPPPKMMRYITQAMIQWEMIEEGDRLLLGLSGGKDSLSLLHCLLEFQKKLPIKFEIEVCTIDPMTPSFDPSPLIPYVEGLGLKYHYIKDDIVARANSSGPNGKQVSSLCAFCARMKRGNLYTCARKNNCNKLVLAQHLDDCAESFFMSMMHNGFLRTMKANYEINAGDCRVIRPLVYCRESLMTEFAKSANLPIINENCPACFEEPKERARIKKLLSREETLYPNLYDHIRRALIPVMHDDSTSIMRSYLEETIAKSRKVPYDKSKKTSATNGLNNHLGAESTQTLPAVNSSTDAKSKNNVGTSLELATEEELIAELARRKAAKYREMKGLSNNKKRDADGMLPEDGTGQMCSLTGGNGTIPCRELME